MTGERSFGRGAVVGDKTLIDALVPCADSWSANTDKTFKENFVLGAAAAVKVRNRPKISWHVWDVPELSVTVAWAIRMQVHMA